MSEPLTSKDLVVGGFYNWKGQPERLSYIGAQRYSGDSRTWHQFALVDKPDACWCEVLESDLKSFEASESAARALAAHTAPPPTEAVAKADSLRIALELDDGSSRTIEVSGSLVHLQILDEVLKNLRRQIDRATPPSAAQPEAVGWKRVPIEPTDEMIEAAYNSFAGAPASVYKAMLAAAPTTEAKPAQADALNTLCKMMHGGEEVEGDDGLAMIVPMDLWNEAQEAIELLVGDDEATEAKPSFMQEIEACKANPGPLGAQVQIGPLPEHTAKPAQQDAVDAARWREASRSRSHGITAWGEFGQRTVYDSAADQLIDAAISSKKGQP